VLGRQVRGPPLVPPPGFPCQLWHCRTTEQLSSLLVALFQEVLPPELFDLLVLTLCRHAPAFAASLSYAKLLTAVLTMYQSQVRAGLGPADEPESWQPGCSWPRAPSILLVSISGHPSPPEPAGCRSGAEQRGSEEIAAGCAGRSQVRWMLRPPGWAGVSPVGDDGRLCPPGLPEAMAASPGQVSLFLISLFFLPGERRRERRGDGFLGRQMCAAQSLAGVQCQRDGDPASVGCDMRSAHASALRLAVTAWAQPNWFEVGYRWVTPPQPHACPET